ncbi:putative choline monooxygenase [Dioscorea sansibarensis]
MYKNLKDCAACTAAMSMFQVISHVCNIRAFPPSYPLRLISHNISKPENGRKLVPAVQSAASIAKAFDPTVSLSIARTPPSCWYTDPSFLQLELEHVFFQGWQTVEHVEKPCDFFLGRLGNVEYLVCRDAKGDLHAFHNTCKHRASLLVSGKGSKSCFSCPYHGWTYGLNGSLLKANRRAGIQNFNKDDFGLVPINVATCGPFVLINLGKDMPFHQKSTTEKVEYEWLGDGSEIMTTNLNYLSVKHVQRREYIIDCNWKVYCDNFLDGGYHVPYAHKGFSSCLNLDTYSTEVYEKIIVQRCESASTNDNRLGSDAFYAFVYPNFMVSRYGPWMETNLVLPMTSSKCQVIFDYFLDETLMDDKGFIEKSLEESHAIQVEDVEISERVQRGLESPAYSSGRYVPSVEMAVHHFHCLLHQSINQNLS